MEAKVLGLGNALVDILVRMPSDALLQQFSLPKGSMQLTDESRSSEIYEAVRGFNPQIVSGGSTCNTICGLAMLGVNTGIIGMIGNDDLGQSFKDDMHSCGVDVSLLRVSQSRSGSCVSLISTDSERTMATNLGAAVELSADDVTSDMFKGATHLYVEGYMVQNPQLIEKAMKLAYDAGLIVMLDLASYNVVEENLDLFKTLIRRYVSVVFANEEEATAFTGREDMEALNEIGEIASNVVVKLGRRGSLVKMGDAVSRVGIVEANSIDTTGAGDLYASGFIFGMINGLSPEQCAQAGAVVSGNVIEVIGTKMDAQRWNRVRQQLRRL